MEKRTILAVILCIAIWLIWQFLFIKPQKPLVTPDGGLDGGGIAQAPGKTQESSGEEKKATEEEPPVERAGEKLVSLKSDLYEAVFSTRGASLKKFTLSSYKERVEGKDIKELEPENLVSTTDEKTQPFAIGFWGENTGFKMPAYTDWSVVEESKDQVTFRLLDGTGQELPVITKSYKKTQEPYVLELEVQIKNTTDQSIKEQIMLNTYASYSQAATSGCGGAPVAARTPACMVNEEILTLSGDGGCMGCSGGSPPQPGSRVERGNQVLWSGIDEQYFLLAAIPLEVNQAVCQLDAGHDGVLKNSLMYPDTEIPPGGTAVHKYRLFAGPKRVDLLERVKGGVGQDEGQAKLNEAVNYGIFSFLCLPMLWLLKVFFSLVGNWGVAIIFLTIVVKVILLPLTQKSMKSMKEMAKLKPMMEELKKKYGDDKQRLNQEMMNLYKVHKINPMGGCFPMLLQMPIWIALYRMLYSSVELYQTPFIPGWISDLSYRDPYFIMPIVLGIAMFLQQKLSPTSADSQQAKMMMYAMPVFFTFIMLYLPSGLVLYIFVNSVLSIGHQLFYNRMTDSPKPVAAKAS